MKELHISRAEVRFGSGLVEPAVIHIDQPPHAPATEASEGVIPSLDDQRRYHQRQARELNKLLHTTLPGGLYLALLGEMLATASREYIVPLPPEPGGEE